MTQPRPAKRPPQKGRPRRKPSQARRRPARWQDTAQRVWRGVNAVPPAWRTVAALMLAVLLFAMINLVVHVVRKPTEMLFPVSGVLKKKPDETWRQYGPLFHEYATTSISPELLAALAQMEGAGDPVAHTYWRWRLTWPPFDIYQPASSAVGMYQMTDPTFADARRYCIRHHSVVDSQACWFSDFYTRILPSHAIELTAAHLDRSVEAILAHAHSPATPQQKQDLAALIHLCGSGPARDFAHHGFQLQPGETCGDHAAAAYLEQVGAFRRQFQRLAMAEE